MAVNITANVKIFFQSWIESLRTFTLENIKLFTLLIIKAWLMLWQSLLRTGGILYLMLLPLISLFLHLEFELFFNWQMAALIFLIRATRPTVRDKTLRYYFKTFILALAAGIFFSPVSPERNASFIINFIGLGLYPLLLSSVSIILTLFIHDARKSVCDFIASIWRACKFWIYNYPFFFIVNLLGRLAFIVLLEINGLIPDSYYIIPGLTVFLFIFLVPLYICAITNFYIKRIHEQFVIYYPEN